MVTGSNPVFGAILDRNPKIWTSNDFLSSNLPQNQDYDTSKQNYDTTPLRLYKVNNTYYYRRRIKQKLIRISLKTKNLKEALRRSKILNLMDVNDMFKLKTKDFKLVFEYDTIEELETSLRALNVLQQQSVLQQYNNAKYEFEQEKAKNEENKENINFVVLCDSYINQKKADARVAKTSLDAYLSTFKLLIDYFEHKAINDLKIEDFEAFKASLIETNKYKNKTINKHLKYLKSYIKFAHERKLIKDNHALALTLLDEIKQEQEYRQSVENYTNEEINNIFNFDYKIPIYNTIFKIAAYTGMRQSEIFNLKKEDIKKENDIYYFNITNSKTVAGIRKIPIHKDILEIVSNANFPLMDGTENAFSKNVRVQLYKIIDKGAGKTFHTLRGTFIENIIGKNIEVANITPMVQQIVGHTKSEKEALTLDRYAKGFNIKLLKDILDNVNYD